MVFLIDKKHFRAQERLSVTQKTGEREIARLTALLRKSEMSVASMEDKIKLKVYRYRYTYLENIPLLLTVYMRNACKLYQNLAIY